jgi:hypothetical protein
MPVPSRSNVILGCTVGVLSSACQSLGLILQRKSYINTNTNNDTNISINNNIINLSYNRSLWHLGLFLFLFANIFGSSIQITSLPLIVLSPLQSIGLVFNTLFHTLLLNEPFTNISLISTLIISLGAFFLAYCGNSLIEPQYNLIQFIQLLKNLNFIYWILINLFIILIISISITIINNQLKKNSIFNYLISLNNKLINSNNKFIYNLLLIYKLLIEFLFNYDNSILKKIKGIQFGILSGILSAFSLLLAKSSIEIILTTFINHDWKSLNDKITYLIVLFFLILCISQLFLLNRGLKNITTSILYPLVFFIYNITSISNSLIFFKQWSQLSYKMLFLLIIGLSLVMSGVFALSLQNLDINDDESLLSPSFKNYDSILNDDLIENDDSNSSPIATVVSNDIDNNTNITTLSTTNTAINTSLTSNIVSPFIKRTTENLNNASRKVSGFLKKSVEFENLPTSPKIKNSENKINQYISFDSLRDMTNLSNKNNSLSSSVNLSNEPDSILANITISNNNINNNISFNNNDEIKENSISHGLNILQPLMNKIKKQQSIENDLQQSQLRPSSLKSSLSIPFSLKNLTSDDLNDEKFSRSKKQNSTSLRNKLDDDYNPNNTFNYSFNNTYEEIQNQMHQYDNSLNDIDLSFNISSNSINNSNTTTTTTTTTNNNNNTTTNNNNNTSNDNNNNNNNLPKLFSNKIRNTDKDLHLSTKKTDYKRLNITPELYSPLSNNRNSPLVSRHRRVLSYEQKELLNELKR